MNQTILKILGVVFIFLGLVAGAFVYFNESQSKKEDFLVKLKEGEEYLKQTNKVSNRKALMLFNELAAQKIPKEYLFRVKFGQAVALEKNKDRLLALKTYKEIASMDGLTPQEREDLEYRLGNLLLKLNQEEEGKAYLGYVLRNSENRELRSQALTSIGDYYFEQRRFDKSAENYSLALQEDRYNVRARVGLEQSLKNLGKAVNYTDVFPENLDYLYSPETTKLFPKQEEKGAPTSSKWFERGRRAYLNKEYNKAIQYLNKALKTTKSSLERERIHYYLTESYIALGEYEEANKQANLVLKNPNPSLDPAAVFKKGVIQFKQGNYKEAIAYFNEVIEKYPEANPNVVSLAEKWRKEAVNLLRESERKENTETLRDDDSEEE